MNRGTFHDTYQRLEDDEGYRAKPYQDHLGVWTIGIGFTSLSLDEARMVLRLRTRSLWRTLGHHLPWVRHAPVVVQQVLLEMAYQLGMEGLLGFRKTLAFLEAEQYAEAADEMLDSLWARQTPERAKRASGRIRGLRHYHTSPTPVLPT
jgi:lysozyme